MKTQCHTILIVLILIFFCKAIAGNGQSVFENFITVKGDQLIDGETPFRFISFNIPNLLSIEDDMAFTEKNAWRLPNEFEINDALYTIVQLGGGVARTYVITVKREDDMEGLPKFVLGPGNFNEEAFIAMDKVLAAANKIGVRLIIPLVDNWRWMGGRPQYAAFRGKDKDDFWANAQLKTDFKKTIEYVLNRRNTITGVSYKDDKAILAWELGNELGRADPGWIIEMAKLIKTIDKNHLVNDGIQWSKIPDIVVENPHIDILSTHHYENNPADMLSHIKESARKAKGKKPYYVGEFGFISTTGVKQVLDYVLNEKVISGALIWSLRFHNRDGGFYWHSEPMGGGLYKAYHWPGFHSGSEYDEKSLLQLLRKYAFTIKGEEPAPLNIPEAPELLPINTVGAISWRGSVGASNYIVERSLNESGPWEQIGSGISDAAIAYGPQFSDNSAIIGKEYFYLVKACNNAGVSEASNIVGPVKVEQLTLVDEMLNFGRLYHKEGKLQLKSIDSRKVKEDFHRLQGEKGSTIIYYTEGPISKFRIFAYANEDQKLPEVSGSMIGDEYISISTNHKSFFTGKLDYEYIPAILLEGRTENTHVQFLQVKYRDKIQIGRIEIVYGKK